MKVSVRMRSALFYVREHQTPEFGVIVAYATGSWAIKRGLAAPAERRAYARTTGVCVRLTEAGYRFTLEIEGKA